jgi:pyridoxamine 5'-phosphate oxidase
VDESELDPDPVRQVTAWYADAVAAGLPQPESMALATTTPNGLPSVRMVLLRGADDRGFSFFTNRESRKARELAANPHAALVLYWQPLHRQARIEGVVEELTSDESATYFATRPRGSQVAAWASAQSLPVASREELDRLFEEADARHAGKDVPLPPFWGGYRLVPDAIELWHGRENRLHDRIRYERTQGGWAMTRLQP